MQKNVLIFLNLRTILYVWTFTLVEQICSAVGLMRQSHKARLSNNIIGLLVNLTCNLVF